MRKIITTIAAALALVFAPVAAFADTTSCEMVQTSPGSPAVPAQPAVLDSIVTPAVTQTLFEFVHRNPNHPNSPRWEPEGWNADSNPNSFGWQSTGATQVIVIEPEKVQVVEIHPAVPEVPAVPPTFEEVCTVLRDEPAPVREPVVPPADTVPAPKPAVPAVPVKAITPVPVKAVTPLASPVNIPTFATPVIESSAKPTELAETGFELIGGLAAMAMLALGSGAWWLSRRIA